LVVAGLADPGAAVSDRGYSLGGSRYLKVCHNLKIGPPPHLDLSHELKVDQAVRELIRAGLVKSAHDCSEGGLAVAIAECCFNPKQRFGAEIKISCSHGPAGRQTSRSDVVTTFFNESQSRIIISVVPEKLEHTLSILREHDVPFQQLGEIGGDKLSIRVNGEIFSWPIADLYDDWWNSIRRAVESDAAEPVPSL